MLLLLAITTGSLEVLGLKQEKCIYTLYIATSVLPQKFDKGSSLCYLTPPLSLLSGYNHPAIMERISSTGLHTLVNRPALGCFPPTDYAQIVNDAVLSVSYCTESCDCHVIRHTHTLTHTHTSALYKGVHTHTHRWLPKGCQRS